MDLIGIRNKNNRQWRLRMYSKLKKLGYKHKPSLSYGQYLIINPNKEFELISNDIFDAFIFSNHIMYEAINEEDFFNFLNKDE